MFAKRLFAAEFHRACFLLIAWATLSCVTSFWSPGAQARETKPFYYYTLGGNFTGINRFKTKEEAFDNRKQTVVSDTKWHPIDLVPTPGTTILNGMPVSWNIRYYYDPDPTIKEGEGPGLVYECGKNLFTSYTIAPGPPITMEVW